MRARKQREKQYLDTIESLASSQPYLDFIGPISPNKDDD